MSGVRREHLITCLAAVAALVAGPRSTGETGPGAGAAGIDWPIVFTQLPPRPELERQPGRCGGTLRCDYGDGGRIVRLDPDGHVTVLTEGFASACGADVSFDGRRILFAAKREAADPWNIWEMNADGSDVRQITRDAGNCRSPAYQATLYVLASTEPWYQVMFVSDAAGGLNESGCGADTNLYSCKLDGSGLRRLTMNVSDDLDPFLMDDGRVLLAGWQRRDLRRGFGGRVVLFGVNTDGTDYALYCGDLGKRIKHMPCQTTDGLVVFVEADAVGWDGAGQLASVTERRHFYSHRQVTGDERWLYHGPSPLPGGWVLVSRRPAGGAGTPEAGGAGTHAVCRLDPRTGRCEQVFDDPQFHDMHARALLPRPQPDGRSSVVNEEHPTGKLYCLNVYLTNPDVQPYMQPGMIRRLRVIEGVSVSASDGPSFSPEAGPMGVGGPVPTPHGIPPIVQKRLLGDFAIEEDGSFQIELPADVPVELQTLDESGLALASCGWIWVKHGEPRGCIGCHEDPELTPENRFVLAVQKPAIRLTLPSEKRRTVDFRRDVMPIIEAKCAKCHDSGTPPVLTCAAAGRFNEAYVSLLEADPACGDRRAEFAPVVGRYIHPGQARTSPLIWRLYGRNTSQPWDATYNAGQQVRMCPPPAEQLTADDKRAFVEWIDLGALWDGIPEADEFTSTPASGALNRGGD